MKINKTRLTFTLFVLAPTLLAILYYLFFASERYYVETKFVIQGEQKVQNDVLGGLASLAGGSSTTSSKNAYIAREYLWSGNLLKGIDPQLGIREHYSDTRYDWWARLGKHATFKEFTDYWYDIVYINHDTTSGITTLGVTAFSADKAYEITRKLLEKAEQQVNQISQRAQNDALNFSRKELDSAEQNLIAARSAVIEFRNSQQEISPEKTTEARIEIVATLESELSAAESELANLQSYLKPDTFQIRSLKNKIAALKQQISNERKSWVNSEKKDESTLNTVMGEYEKLLTKKTIAERLYESALGSLENARITAMQQQQYLEVIVAPQKPDEPEEDYKLHNILSVLIGSFLIWAIGTLLISAIKDHV